MRFAVILTGIPANWRFVQIFSSDVLDSTAWPVVDADEGLAY